jgi:adenine-specific DNA-methyltransferase
VIYGRRKSGGEHGTVFTRPEVVDFMLDLVGLKTREDFLAKRIIDPSVGEGAFVLGLVERMLSALDDAKEIEQAMSNITVVELDPDKLAIFKRLLQAAIEKSRPDLRDLWKRITVVQGDYLLAASGEFDVVIGNPPYVRLDNLPPEKIDQYRTLFSCFRARCDLYVAFIEKALKSLRPGGVLAYICADRWLTNGYGISLRKLIARNFHLAELIKISGFSPFNEEVAAYPSIFAIKNENPGNIRYCKASSVSELNIRSLGNSEEIEHIDESGELRFRSEAPGCVSIEEQGFTIGIGVASGADDVFIVAKSDVRIEKTVLVPLLMREDVSDTGIVWNDRYIINPFRGESPDLVDLSEYPQLSLYLEAHRTRLQSRYVARRNPRCWYKTIDRIYPSLLKEPKLLIPDISNKNNIILDEGRFYPHHNFYYVRGKNLKDLAVLRALLSTDFARTQVAEKGVLMNGGSLRWQAQTLRKLRLPDIRSMSEDRKDEIIAAYNSRNFKRVEELSQPQAA